VVMMSVFLGEFYHLSRSRRFLLLGFALLLALAGNYARLLFLAWRGAHAGIASVGALHDSAGFGILVFTVLGLWIICLALPRGEAAAPFSNASREKKIFPAHPASQPAIWAAALLLSALLSEVCTQAWYAYRENSTPSLPAWTVLLPARAPNFHPLPISPASHALLGDAASNTAAWSDERGWRWNALWFRYDSRTADKIIFDLHNPEACLPAAGFRETRDDGASTQIIRGIPLRTQRYLFTTDAGRSMYVFWIAYLLHGELDDFQHHQLLNGDSLPAFFARGFSWCRDAWHGLRGTEAQTLEITIAGPDNAADAQRTYLDFIDTAIEPQPRR
jgi:exosortase/archaeosortase family protein